MPRLCLITCCVAGVVALVPPTQPRQRLTVAHNVASAKPNARNAKYVDQLLDVVSKTDRGVRAKEGTRNIIDGLIARLERSYKGTDASETPEWLYRDSEVVYVGQRSSKRANAAGGRFRGRVGRLLFRTTALYQHIQKDGDSLRAVNANRFRFLGLLPGCAVLRGAAEKENDIEALSAKFDRSLSENTLRASFEQPKIAFGPLVFEAGPASVVRLDTTYLDDRVLTTARKITNRDRSRRSTLLWDVDLARTDMRQEAPSGAHRDRERRGRRARAFRPRSCRLLTRRSASRAAARRARRSSSARVRTRTRARTPGSASPRQRRSPRKRRVSASARWPLLQRAPPRESGPRTSHLRLLWSSPLLPPSS
jgi:hypothetical protein